MVTAASFLRARTLAMRRAARWDGMSTTGAVLAGAVLFGSVVLVGAAGTKMPSPRGVTMTRPVRLTRSAPSGKKSACGTTWLGSTGASGPLVGAGTLGAALCAGVGATGRTPLGFMRWRSRSLS